MDTNSLKIGITHPGQMGSSVGAVLVEAGHDVMWASEGRSEETTQRAVDAGSEMSNLLLKCLQKPM